MAKTQEVPTKVVDVVNHDWRVIQKVQRGKVNYYLLECQNHVGAYDVIKESLSSLEHFTGRMIILVDKERVYREKKFQAKGKFGMEEYDHEEPYRHHLRDSGKCTLAEVRGVFGEKFESFWLVPENDEESKEFLFYEQEVEKPKPKKPAPSKVSK